MTLSDLSASLTPSFISTLEEASLLTHICAHLDALPFRRSERSRIARFGWDYRGRQKVEPVPKWCLPCVSFSVFPPDCVTLNEYQPGRAISPHVDPLEFGDPILILGLASACDFELSLGAQKLSFTFPARALLSLAGPSRFPWHHAIKPVKALRYSLVFRWLKEPMNPKAIRSPLSQTT